MKPAIEQVVADDMCIACGACVYACPEDVVKPAFNDMRGAHEIEVVDREACSGCAAPCEVVCPSLNVDLMALLGPIERSGPISSTWLGYAPAHRDNGVSSSGGILRAFVAASLKQGRPVVCLADAGDGYRAELLTSLDDLRTVPGSIYHSVSFTDAIGRLQSADRPCLLVSTPCQLEGISQYIKTVEPELAAKIDVRVGLICGWMYTHHSLAAFASYKGIDEPIVDASYRGDDEVGLLRLKTEDGEHAFNRRTFEDYGAKVDYRASFSRYANRLRCRVCQNHTNVLADIAVGDAWLERKEGEKTSIIVVRTDRGESELQALRETEQLVLEPAADTDLIESQSADLVYGNQARRLTAFLEARGTTAPEFKFRPSEDQEPAAGWAEMIAFRFELWMRRQLRTGRYRRYRLAFIGRNLLRAAAGPARRRR